jgi:hypothetical protein
LRVRAVVARRELDEVDLAAAPGEDPLEGLVGRGDVESRKERRSAGSTDLEGGRAAVGVEAVDELVGRAVAAEARSVRRRPGGLAADSTAWPAYSEKRTSRPGRRTRRGSEPPRRVFLPADRVRRRSCRRGGFSAQEVLKVHPSSKI